MTRKELLKAYELRMDGLTWDEIGERLFYTGRYIKESLLDSLDLGKRKRVVRSKVYPRLAEHITKRYDGNVSAFAEKVQVSPSVLYRMLKGGATKPESLSKIRNVVGELIC